MAEPWDKLSGECDEAYSRFLIYRNLGPKRSLKRAYLHFLRTDDEYTGGIKRLHVPGQWHRDCVDQFWVDRAAAWDVRNLSAYGSRLAAFHVRTITQLAEKNARYAAKLNPGDDGWTDLMASVKAVQGFLTPEVVRGIQERNQPTRATVGTAANADPDE